MPGKRIYSRERGENVRSKLIYLPRIGMWRLIVHGIGDQ